MKNMAHAVFFNSSHVQHDAQFVRVAGRYRGFRLGMYRIPKKPDTGYPKF